VLVVVEAITRLSIVVPPQGVHLVPPEGFHLFCEEYRQSKKRRRIIS
jgi:hypothetical protein